MKYIIQFFQSFSALLLRYYDTEKIVSKINVIRLDHNNNMTGQQLEFWQSHQSKFDERDFRDIPIPPSDD